MVWELYVHEGDKLAGWGVGVFSSRPFWLGEVVSSRGPFRWRTLVFVLWGILVSFLWGVLVSIWLGVWVSIWLGVLVSILCGVLVSIGGLSV